MSKWQKSKTESSRATFATSMKEMAGPRFVESPEKSEDANHPVTEHATDRLTLQSRVWKHYFPGLGLLQMCIEVQPVRYVHRQIRWMKRKFKLYREKEFTYHEFRGHSDWPRHQRAKSQVA